MPKTLDEALLREKRAELEQFAEVEADKVFSAEVAMRVIDGLLADEPMTQVLSSEEIQGIIERNAERMGFTDLPTLAPEFKQQMPSKPAASATPAKPTASATPPKPAEAKPASGEKLVYVPVKDTIMGVLTKKMTATDIVEAAKAKKIELNEGSVNATLSRLTKSGEVVRGEDGFYTKPKGAKAPAKKAA